MWEIWANLLLQNALKTCPMSNKSPNLVTLVPSQLTILNQPYQRCYVTQKFLYDFGSSFEVPNEYLPT